MTAITALLAFTAWTLVLMFIYVGYRVGLVLTFKKPANAWTRGQASEDPAFIVRAHHAHLNCAENLPVFAAVVLAASVLGKLPVVDAIACWFLAARIAQSVVHLISTAPLMVFVRANLFVIQVLMLAWVIWGLLH